MAVWDKAYLASLVTSVLCDLHSLENGIHRSHQAEQSAVQPAQNFFCAVEKSTEFEIF